MVAFLFVAGCGKQGPKEVTSKNLKKASEFEGGVLYKAGKIYVVQLNGDYHEMGRQYGGLMKSQIEQFYKEAVEDNLAKQVPLSVIDEMSDSIYKLYPERMRLVLDGMEETSGMSLKELKAVDAATALGLGVQLQPQCSSVAAWGDYTVNGDAILGRTFDYMDYFQDLNDNMTVAVFNPTDGSESVATLGYAGQVSSFNSYNDKGLVLEMHAGTIGMDMNFPDDRTPPFINNVCFMLDSPDFDTLDAYIKSTRVTFPFIEDVATAKEVYSYEDDQSRCVRRQGEVDGLLASANTYLDPSWVVPPEAMQLMGQEYWEESDLRRQNLLNLAEENKGKIDVAVMKKILDTPRDQGGALFSDISIYQFIAVPAELQLYVKAVNYQDWVQIELDKLFYREEPE
jgi:hypothetical protein